VADELKIRWEEENRQKAANDAKLASVAEAKILQGNLSPLQSHAFITQQGITNKADQERIRDLIKTTYYKRTRQQ
jgi:hypothetical protein